MLQASTLAFLEKLKANNNRDWFLANKTEADDAKADFKSFITILIERISSEFDPGVSDQEAKKCIFRLNRDVRFSKNKDPYKTNFGAAICPGGRKSGLPGYYIHLEPGKCFLAGGCWFPASGPLKKIRQEIDYNTDEFRAILADKNFRKHFGQLSGDQLKTAPRDYPKDHPAIDLLRFKSFTSVEEFPPKDITSKKFADKIIKSFSAMKPLNDFLRRAIVD